MGKTIGTLVMLAAIGALGWLVVQRTQDSDSGGSSRPGRGQRGAVPVEVAAVQRGAISELRIFSGTLSARSAFTVAPKVGGRIERLAVDLGDRVKRGQVVAELDDDEFVQEVAQAQAALAVAEAQLAEADNAAAIAQREFDRAQTLRERGIASESELDRVSSQLQAQLASLQVARAQVRRAEAALEGARIRMNYTRVTATWPGEDEQRVVGQRFVDAGDTVGANTALLTVVEIDPLLAVVAVTERDYARLSIGQAATIRADAFPGESFAAEIIRLAPVFSEASRQARVELLVANDERRLKPGMFARVSVVLDHADDVSIVPAAALVRRGGEQGVFVVDVAGEQVRWQPVRVGIRQGERVQVDAETLGDRVVVLGQQLLEDGSAIIIPERREQGAGRAP